MPLTQLRPLSAVHQLFNQPIHHLVAWQQRAAAFSSQQQHPHPHRQASLLNTPWPGCCRDEAGQSPPPVHFGLFVNLIRPCLAVPKAWFNPRSSALDRLAGLDWDSVVPSASQVPQHSTASTSICACFLSCLAALPGDAWTPPGAEGRHPPWCDVARWAPPCARQRAVLCYDAPHRQQHTGSQQQQRRPARQAPQAARRLCQGPPGAQPPPPPTAPAAAAGGAMQQCGGAVTEEQVLQL